MQINNKKQLFYIFLTAISLLTIFGAAVYYFYKLNWIGIIISLFLTLSVSCIIAKKWIPAFAGMTNEKKKIYHLSFTLLNKTKKNILALFKYTIYKFCNALFKRNLTGFIIYHLIYFFFLLSSLLFLHKTRTDTALTSPWQVVGAKFFISYILATATLIWTVIKKSRFSIYLIMAHYFLSFSVLWIIFKFGYGFDLFIHQATVDLIDKQGAVEPKNFYYLGQYALEIFAHKIFFIPINWADKLLVPILAALTIPPAIFLFFKKNFIRNNLAFSIHHLALISILILPFSIFTLTVPQNLAYLFLILSVFIGLIAKRKFELTLSALLALAAFTVHPIAGIPAVLFVAALLVKNIGFCRKQNRSVPCSYASKIILSIIFILTALSLPAAFYFANRSQENINGTEIQTSAATSFSLDLIFPRTQNIILNFIQIFSVNQWLWLSLLGAAEIIFTWRWRKKNPKLLISSGFSLSLLAAFIITKKFLNFSYLITYERGDFLERIIILSFLFLLPGIILVFYRLLEKISQQNNFIKISWTAFGVLLIAASLYCSYPRKDNYFNSRSFSVGQSDFEAVEWIENDAGEKPYVVLANQQVSVAALKTFGFSKYFKNNIYFYPIPTGGPLYQIYLDMVYKKADKKTALKAAELTGVNTIYFVLNKYWWAFDKIAQEAKIETSTFQNINNKILIFKYTKIKEK